MANRGTIQPVNVVEPVDASGNVKVNVVAGGTSGTEYDDGDVRGTATGGLIMGDDTTNIQSVRVDTDGHLQVDVLSGSTSSVAAVDANNSTTTPLGGGAVFTGTGTDCLDYRAVTITLFADVDSATDGMTFQFSTDNTNWDDVYTYTMDVSSSDTRRFQFPITAQYFRVVYTNGAGAQSAFRVQTLLHPGNVLTSIHRVQDLTNDDRSCQLVKSVITGKRPNGLYTNFQATAGGNFKVAIEEIEAGVLFQTAVEELDETSDVTSTTITTSGSSIIANVGAGEQCRVHQVYIGSNDDFTPCVFDIRWLTGGTGRYKTQLVSKGSRIPNLIGPRPLTGATGEDLFINVDVADSNLEVTVVFEAI